MNTLADLQQWFSKLRGPYQLRVSREYTPEMDTPRCAAFPEANHAASNRDVYDDRALHLTISLHGELAAYSRLIPGPGGFFQALTAHPLLVDSEAAIDWSRLVIPSPFRKLGLPAVMGQAALLVAYALGYRYVHGAANPGRQLISLLHQLDFQEVDSPVSVTVLPATSFFLQLFTCDVNALSYSLKERLLESWQQLNDPALT